MTLFRRSTDSPKPLSCALAVALALSGASLVGAAHAQSQAGQQTGLAAAQSNDAAAKSEADKRREAEAAAKAEADRKADARKPKSDRGAGKGGDKNDPERELEEEEDL